MPWRMLTPAVSLTVTIADLPSTSDCTVIWVVVDSVLQNYTLNSSFWPSFSCLSSLLVKYMFCLHWPFLNPLISYEVQFTSIFAVRFASYWPIIQNPMIKHSILIKFWRTTSGILLPLSRKTGQVYYCGLNSPTIFTQVNTVWFWHFFFLSRIGRIPEYLFLIPSFHKLLQLIPQSQTFFKFGRIQRIL